MALATLTNMGQATIPKTVQMKFRSLIIVEVEYDWNRV